ncbi:MAG: exonuclease domain-containing protein [Pseudomonadota bacterium]
MIGDARWRWMRRWKKAAETAHRAASGSALADYYAAGPPDMDVPWQSAPLIAIDLETDGLDARSDMLLEAGWVALSNGAVRLATAQRLRISAQSDLRASSVVIHGITDDAAQKGSSEADMLAALLPLLGGAVIVAHNAVIEQAFLDAACRRVFGAPLLLPAICTMDIEMRWFPRERTHDGLRLGTLRARHGLPAYHAHDGLVDAMASGELLLAQIAAARRDRVSLAELIRW